jgi:RHS repeat-associated protein
VSGDPINKLDLDGKCVICRHPSVHIDARRWVRDWARDLRHGVSAGAGVVSRNWRTATYLAAAGGDVMAVAKTTGAKVGVTMAYDPFGQPLNGVPENGNGNFDYGWLGTHDRGLEHTGSLATIEMVARQYVPSLGRFLQVDPAEGGSANDYDYGDGDCVNHFDIDGTVYSEDPSGSKYVNWSWDYNRRHYQHPVCKKIHGTAKVPSFGGWVRVGYHLGHRRYRRALGNVLVWPLVRVQAGPSRALARRSAVASAQFWVQLYRLLA